MTRLQRRIAAADERYGPFTSTHEALGVASEEWDEFRTAIHENDADAIVHEALDLAAVLVRLAAQIEAREPKLCGRSSLVESIK